METYISLKAKLTKALLFAQKIVQDSSYTFHGKAIPAEDLAGMLFKEPEATSMYLKFHLAQYDIRITAKLLSKQSFSVRLFVKEDGLDCLDFTETIYPGIVKEKNMQIAITETILKVIGTNPNLLMANSITPSLIGVLADKISMQQGKRTALLFNRPKAIDRLVRKGDKKELRRILRLEYVEHKPVLIPEVRYALQLISLHLLKECDEKAAA